MTDTDQKNGKMAISSSVSFIREVAKYFMDFLETDFHKRKNPKRSVQLRNRDNLLIGLNLNKYPDFNKKVWELINKGFNERKTVIEKGYTKPVSPRIY